ncbi:beclin 1-associated autophagy-related key regulator-like [Liolophura sinensis]|uniref:beclin 1-associated autophagy-related key regulator-like n=1 Tax=Liolophura sinensis TaxID=3198878 RepID=UPI0031585C0E
MAARSFDSDSNNSLAPIEFHFTASVDSCLGLSVAVERCPLCCSSRRPFYCKTCILDGQFPHSSDDASEMYSSRLQKWEAQKKEREKLLERIQKAVQQKHAIGLKHSALEQCRQTISLLRKALAKSQEDLSTDEMTLKKLQESQIGKSRKSVKRREKIGKINQYIAHVQGLTEKNKGLLQPVAEELRLMRKHHVEKLVSNIFPVTDIQPRSEPDSLALSTVSALKDASHTAYIKGRWVYADHNGDLQYKVVESTLPGSGDYSAYNLWIATSKENVTTASETKANQRNPAYAISAALCYTAQLTTVLGHILDLTLPRKLCYSEFCGDDLTEKQFNSCVARLNENILYLCFSQGVDLDLVFPRHTLHNILALLSSPHLGRESAFEVNPELVESIEEEILPSDDSEDERRMSDDDADLGLEWERVPQELADYDFQTHTRSLSSGSSDLQQGTPTTPLMSQTTQLPTGLMSSAAASVASFWRAATGHFERR